MRPIFERVPAHPNRQNKAKTNMEAARVSIARRNQRDQMRRQMGSPTPDRTSQLQPGEDGYESSDIEGELASHGKNNNISPEKVRQEQRDRIRAKRGAAKPRRLGRIPPGENGYESSDFDDELESLFTAEEEEQQIAASKIRQEERDRIRRSRGGPRSNRRGRVAPGDVGYESSDVEEAPGQNDERDNWREKQDYKRMIKTTAKRAQGIKAVLAENGIIGDARFWFELGKTAHQGDYSSAVEHAVSQNQTLGMETPDTSSSVSKHVFTKLVHSHMKFAHGQQYLDETKNALTSSTNLVQGPNELGDAYFRRANSQREAVSYILEHPDVSQRERATLESDFIAAWIRGLSDGNQSRKLLISHEEGRLNGMEPNHARIVAKVTAAERVNKRHTDDRQGIPSKRVDRGNSGEASATACLAAAMVQQQTVFQGILASQHAPLNNVNSQIPPPPGPPPRNFFGAPNPPPPGPPPRNFFGAPNPPPGPPARAGRNAFPKDHPNGRGASLGAPGGPPLFCRYCQHKGLQANHDRDRCPFRSHPGTCDKCGDANHSGMTCAKPCLCCAKKTAIGVKIRHEDGCPRIPQRKKQ